MNTFRLSAFIFATHILLIISITFIENCQGVGIFKVCVRVEPFFIFYSFLSFIALAQFINIHIGIHSENCIVIWVH